MGLRSLSTSTLIQSILSPRKAHDAVADYASALGDGDQFSRAVLIADLKGFCEHLCAATVAEIVWVFHNLTPRHELSDHIHEQEAVTVPFALEAHKVHVPALCELPDSQHLVP